MRELLAGCGNSRIKKFSFDDLTWDELVTIDHDPNCGADVVHDLEDLPWPFEDDAFDAVHMYEVLEHLGSQGDFKAFFAQFGEIWRILKADGLLYATVPHWKSQWAWGDPSHTRVITPGTLMFLSQEEYAKQVGTNAMSDFRWLWQKDFRPEHIECTPDEESLRFVLRAVKEQ